MSYVFGTGISDHVRPSMHISIVTFYKKYKLLDIVFYGQHNLNSTLTRYSTRFALLFTTGWRTIQNLRFFLAPCLYKQKYTQTDVWTETQTDKQRYREDVHPDGLTNRNAVRHKYFCKDLQANAQTYRCMDTQTYRQTYEQTYRQTYRKKIYQQRDIKMDRCTNRLTGEQMYGHTGV